jgi:hypothetical protein
MAHSERTFALFPILPQEIRLIIWEHALPGPRVVNLRQRKLKKTIGEWETETGKPWPPMKEGLEEEDTGEEEDNFLVGLRDSSRWRGRERFLVSDTVRDPLRANEYDDEAYKAGHLVAFVSDCPPPEILSVCREAFEVVSKRYQKVFSTLGSVPTTWICFELDTLYLRYNDFPVYYADDSISSMIGELNDSGFMLQDMENLCRVKNLAILKPQNGQRPEWELVITEYSKTIGGLETLYLVLKDYQESADDVKSLSLMDPIDLSETMAVYESFNPLDYGGQVPEPQLLDLLKDWEGVADVPFLLDLEASLENDIKGGATPWKIPKIEEKAVFPIRLVNDMESMRSHCNMTLEACSKEGSSGN